MKVKFIFLMLFFLSIISCRKDNRIIDQTFYHVFIVAGQSNTHYGFGYDNNLDVSDSRIMQFGRHNGNDYKIIQANHPMDHHTGVDSSIGFAMTFSKLYLKDYVLKGEKILIIPAGKAGSSFIENDWRLGGSLSKDLKERVRYVLSVFPNSELKAMLWHQGESDVKNNFYQNDLDTFIDDIRHSFENKELIFILGGMVPYWVAKDQAYKKIQTIIKKTPERISRTAYADPNLPFVIEKELNSLNQLHYNAKGLREMGSRYYAAYKAIN